MILQMHICVILLDPRRSKFAFQLGDAWWCRDNQIVEVGQTGNVNHVSWGVTCEDVYSISLAGGTPEGNCGAC